MLNVQDVILGVKIVINYILDVVCATCNKVTDDARQNIILDVINTTAFTSTRHDEEVDIGATHILGILVVEVTNNFFCDVIAVFPNEDTRILESLTSRCQDFQQRINQSTDFIQSCLSRRSGEVVRNSQSLTVSTRQIATGSSQDIIDDVTNNIPCVKGLKNLITNVLQFS